MSLTNQILLRGIHTLALDVKGRMTMPGRYRPSLKEHADNHLVVTIDTESHCLLLYPLPQWELVQTKIANLSSFNKAARRIQRLLIGHATDVDLDSSGRVLLPPPLREYASLDKKVILLGQCNKFELWSESAWQQERDSYIDMAGSDQLTTRELEQISL